MDSSDSLQLDEHLARLLAAYDQAIEGADANAPTIGVKRPSSVSHPEPREKTQEARNGAAPNEGSIGELLPDGEKTDSVWLPKLSATPPPGGPHRVGRFELRKQLGKGGCGIVFLAYDPKLEREVALKIPRPEMLLSDDARRRLVREALAAAEFDHPNLVPVYETGEIGPVCFIATAFCPGLTLGEWLEKQSFPVPVRQAARLMAIIAEAVQHAHDRGVLHRDLKPNNVILQEVREDPNEMEPPVGSCQLRGDHYIPRVVDFGLAKLLERGGPSETVTRQVLGTPKYMAPEQAQARHSDVGPTADVYALGVILYELLTGRAPFEGATDVEILRQAIDGYLTSPRHLRRDIPRDLEAICLKAMMRIPQKRYRTAIDFADDLRRFLDGKPTLARPLNFLARIGLWLRRNDQAVALVVVTTIAALMFAFWMMSTYQTRLLRSDQEKTKLAEEARTRVDHQQDYARHVREAFLAWRSGDMKSATASLDAARKSLEAANRLDKNENTPDFAHEYLARLIAAEKLTLVCPAGPITALGVSHDGVFLATGHGNGTISLWHLSTGRRLASIPAHARSVAYVSFLKSGELISSENSTAGKTWLISKQGEVSPGPIYSSAIELPPPVLPTARWESTVFTGGSDGIVRGWDLSQDPAFFVAESLGTSVLGIGVDQDGNRFVAATTKPELLTFQAMKRQQTLPGLQGKPLSVLFAKDQALLALFIRDRAAIVSELQTSSVKERFRIAPASTALTAAQLSHDGTRLIAGDETGQVYIWSIVDQSLVASFNSDEKLPVKAITISPDGRFFAYRLGDQVVLWREGETSPRATFPSDDYSLLKFVPDGNQLITTANGGIIKVWDTLTGVAEHTLHGHAGQVTGLAVSPNGRTLVSGGINGEVKFWDLMVGQETMEFQRHRGPVSVIEFSANGKLLVTGGSELAVWPAARE